MSGADDLVHKDLQAIAGGTGLSLLGRVINGGFSFLYGIVLARLLDIHSVGVMMLALAIIRIAEFVGRMGLELGTLHYVAILAGKGNIAAVRGTVRNALRMVVMFGLGLAGILAVCATLMSVMFEMPDLAGVIRILSVSLVPTSMTMILLAALLGLKQFGYNTICERIILPAANLVICGALLLAGFGIVGASVAYVAAALLTFPLAARYFGRSAPPADRAGTPIASSELLRFSAPLVLVIILTQMLFWTDIVMLGLLRDASEVGVYSAAARTAFAANMIVAAANQIFAPTISHLYHRGDLTHLEALFKTVSKWMFLATLPAVMLLLLLSEEVLHLFGPAFVAGKTALIILALAQLVDASTGTATFMLTMSGRLKLMVFNTGIALVLNVALNALLVPRFGIDGAAAATFLALGAFQMLALIETRWTLGMHPYSVGYLKPLAAGIAAFAIVGAVKDAVGEMPYMLAIVVYSAGYAVVYLGALFVAGFPKEDELVLSAIKGKLRRAA
jgi:O-antigen/teichoic acid export membrane protein